MLAAMLAGCERTTWLLGLAGVTSLAWLAAASRDRKLPPAPGLALPVIGHLYMVPRVPLQKFQAWARRLGPVFRLRMGGQLAVVVTGQRALREAFVKKADSFSDRPPSSLKAVFPKANMGIILNSGPDWKEQRSVTLSILREFGMGKNLLAEKVQDEVTAWIEALMKLKSQPADIRRLTNKCVSNVICNIIFGQRFSLDDPAFNRMIDVFNEQTRKGTQLGLFQFFPFLRFLPFDPFGVKKYIKISLESGAFTRAQVERCLAQAQPGPPANFSDAYIREMKRKTEAGEKTYLDENNLRRVISNLFVAGTETTSSAILWCLLYMLHYPDVQKKVHMEINEVVGCERKPDMSDKPKLKYFNAFIMETLRIAGIASLGLLHYTPHDTDLCGYHIPKGTMVIPNLYATMLDEDVWGDPTVFRPERFLDDNGDIVKEDSFLPFGLGRRVCLGESLARMELVLFLATAFQKFEFKPKEPGELPELRGDYGVTMPPCAYQVRCVPRD